MDYQELPHHKHLLNHGYAFTGWNKDSAEFHRPENKHLHHKVTIDKNTGKWDHKVGSTHKGKTTYSSPLSDSGYESLKEFLKDMHSTQHTEEQEVEETYLDELKAGAKPPYGHSFGRN